MGNALEVDVYFLYKKEKVMDRESDRMFFKKNKCVFYGHAIGSRMLL